MNMAELLNDGIKQQVREAFSELPNPVKILFFGSQVNCEYCDETKQLLEEVVALSPQLSLSTYDLISDLETADKYRVDKAPAFVVAAMEDDNVTDTGIQYAGIPSGHEFSTLIQDIILVSSRNSGLSEDTRKVLKVLQSPMLLQVFVTPTCPYCPRAVVLAHQMAMENPAMIRAEGIEAMEFQDLASRFNVSGVPQTTINNGAGMVVGAVPEKSLLMEIQRVIA
jgi:glutaredoxin-like protein